MKKVDLDLISNYYKNKLIQFGDTPKGVDWNSLESQELRFKNLISIIEKKENFSILDYGCGTASLYEFLSKKGYVNFKYFGFDINQDVISICKKKYFDETNLFFSSNLVDFQKCDYVISSGIFNVKLQNEFKNWKDFIRNTIIEFSLMSNKGFSFNMLNTFCDENKKKDYLYYENPGDIFEYIIKNISKELTLINSSTLYDFSILVKK